MFLFHRLYKFYNKRALRALVYFCVWLNLCLALFEAPAVSGMGLPYWVWHSLMCQNCHAPKDYAYFIPCIFNLFSSEANFLNFVCFFILFPGYNVVRISLPVCIHSPSFPCLVFCCWCEILARQEKCYFVGCYCGKIFLLFYRRLTMRLGLWVKRIYIPRSGMSDWLHCLWIKWQTDIKSKN